MNPDSTHLNQISMWVNSVQQISEREASIGAEFDQCFMGQQIMGHLHMIDELKVLSLHVSSDMQKDLEESRQKAANHLEQAKKIAESLKSGSERVSSKPKAESWCFAS